MHLPAVGISPPCSYSSADMLSSVCQFGATNLGLSLLTLNGTLRDSSQ